MPKLKRENKEPGVHFRRSSDGQFFVLCIGHNSEPLQQSETLELKASCEVNIAAMVKLLSDPELVIIDESKERVSRYKFSEIFK